MKTVAHNAHRQKKLDKLTDNADPDKQKAAQELVETIGDSQDILVKATTVFPLTLFPDTISVDRTKITITHRTFIYAGDELSIAIEDVLNITATVGPFFGKITLATRFFDPSKPYEVDHFWRDDALKIKRIVQGYLIARQKEIDTSALSTKELAKALDELGKNQPDENI
jgi:hypothetical protein